MIPENNPNWNLLPQSWWFADNLGEENSCKVFLYENLKELEDYFNIKLQKVNQSHFESNKFYRDAYNKNTREYIEKLDWKIIQKYNYKF